MKKIILGLCVAFVGFTLQAQDTMTKENVQKSNVEVEQEKIIVVQGDDKEESISLDGGTLHVKGNNVVVHAAGNADKIIVEGNNCQIVVDETKEIEINGEKSYVYYRKGEPKATVSDGSAIQKIEG